MKRKIKKYAFGDFVEENQDGIGAGLGFGTQLLGMFDNPRKPSGAIAGGQGALQGAAMGLQFGPLGAGIGGAIGLGAGLLSAGKQRKLIQAQDNKVVQDYNSLINSNMTTMNTNKYGVYADGGPVKKGKKASTYDASLLTNGKFLVTKADGSIGQWGNPIDSTTNKILPQLTPQILLSDKARGLSNTYYPARDVQQGATIPTQKRSANYFADGGEVPMNEINIQKGELQIDPSSGKVIRKYKGINPETGGLYEDHAKKEKDESPNNIVTAKEGTFIITKKLAPKYQEALDNNDKLSKNTILMNIRNNKEMKEGMRVSVPKFADGGYNITSNKLRNLFPNMGNQLSMYTPSIPSVGGIMPQANYSTLGQPIGASPNNSPSAGRLSNLLDDKETALGKVGNYLPAAANVLQGLFGKTEQMNHINPITNPYKNQILANLPKDIDNTAAINDMNAASRVSDVDLKNNTNSSSVYRANKQQLAANLQRNIGQLQTQTQLQNNGIAQSRASIYNNLGAQDMEAQMNALQYNQGIDQFNMQNRAAKQNLLNTGIGQLQQVGQNDRQNQQLRQMDLYKLSLLQDMNPFAKYYENLGGNLGKYKLGGMVTTRKATKKK